MTKPHIEINANILSSVAGDNIPLMLPNFQVNNQLFERLKPIRGFWVYY